MSKKLINEVSSVVDDALKGLVAVNPGLCLLEGHRVVVRSDIKKLKDEEKVTILSGGGSGHEPAHAGFVGKGMLSAAIAGSVFTSPPPGDILAALRCICGRAGTLMIVKNYTGDRLNFGIAAESAKAEGMKVEMVIVGEDCALSSNIAHAGRRGLCGTVLVHKIAGALADGGGTLNEVTEIANSVAANIATMSVSLSPCSVPGQEPSFHLEQDEMELGLGIHGEAGVKRTKLQPANAVAKLLVDHMVTTDDYFTLTAGDEVGVVVNNLGGTSNLELAVMANDTIRYLVDVRKVNVVRAYMGSLMTSLEMAGVSVTLIKLASLSWTEYLDAATTAPAWPNPSLGVGGSYTRVDKPPLVVTSSSVTSPTTLEASVNTTLGRVLKTCTEGVSTSLLANEALLNELDRGSGDGDCGSTLKSGAQAVLDKLSSFHWDAPSDCLLTLSKCIGAHMGGTSGAIYSIFLTVVAATISQYDVSSLADGAVWTKALRSGMEAIKRYGGARVGDRTMLDALSPAIDALEQSSTLTGLQNAVEAAKKGAEDTRNMAAHAGRASYVSPELLTQPDPGAIAVGVWLQAIHSALCKSQ